MSLINTLERRLGRFAIPNLIRFIVIFQTLNWFLIRLVPEFVYTLAFDPDAIRAGEVWRFASFILLPGSASILWAIFALPWGWMISDGLEEAWGSFRVNLYIFGGMAAVATGGLVFGYATTGRDLWSTLIFAFAMFYPNQEISLWVLIPIPMRIKWLGIITGGALFMDFLLDPGSRLMILCSVLNFFVAFGPGLLGMARQRSRVASRRQQFNAQRPAEDTPLHQCVRCGKTDMNFPHLDFRVNAEGDDVCSDCRAAQAAKS